MDGALLIGQLVNGFATPTELKLGLMRSGFAHGIVEAGIQAIGSGSRSQHVLAKAETVFSPAQADYFVQSAMTEKQMQSVCGELQISRLHLMHSVEHGQTLLKISQRPSYQLINPDGFIKKEYPAKLQADVWAAGMNSQFNEAGDTVSAEKNGLAHFGFMHETIVSLKEKVSLSELYDLDSAAYGSYSLDADIENSGSLSIPGSLISDSDVLLENLVVEGNLEVNTVKALPMSKEPFTVSVSRNMVVRNIARCDVYCESKVAVLDRLSDSRVRALKCAAVREIVNSEVVVGRSLYVRNVLGKSHLKIGQSFVTSRKLKELCSFNEKILQKHILLDFEIKELREKIETAQNKLKMQLVNAQKRAAKNQRVGLILRRLYEGFLNYISELEVKTRLFEVNFDLLTYLASLIDIYESDFSEVEPSEILCFGTIEPGVIISTENQSYTVNRTLKEVSIKVDTTLGSFEIVPLTPEQVELEQNVSAQEEE